MSTPVVRVRDLEFRYREGEFRLRVPELDVETGSSLALVGPSGSGKTTLLNLVAGIVTPAKGKVETAGVDVAALSESERRAFRIQNVGLVFQEFELLEYLSVLDNILLPYRIHPVLSLTKDVTATARGLADAAGIGDKLARFPTQLSQGERQRVAVCRAVLVKPALLLADEPTGNLDPKNKGRVLEILFDCAKTILTVESFVVAGAALLGLATLSVATLVFLLSLRLRRRGAGDPLQARRLARKHRRPHGVGDRGRAGGGGSAGFGPHLVASSAPFWCAR